MPCNTVQWCSVDLGKVDAGVLEQAITEEYGPVAVMSGFLRFYTAGRAVDVRDGRLVSQLPERSVTVIAGKIKQACARVAVQRAARRFGWTVEKSTDANKFRVRKG